MIDLSDSNIKKTAVNTGFIKDSVEKVMRLIDVLEEIFSSDLKAKRHLLLYLLLHLLLHLLPSWI